MALLTMRVECFPTEDPSKVLKALLNIFPDSEIEECEGGFVAKSDSAERFKELLRNLRILDTARKILRKGRQGNRAIFRINKQVACVGKISFVEGEMPLGSVEVVLESEDIDAVIDEIAPRTVDGEIP